MPRSRTQMKVESAPKRWLNKNEAMNYLGVSEDFLDKLRNEALVSFSQFGRRMIWYDIESLDKFIKEHKVI